MPSASAASGTDISSISTSRKTSRWSSVRHADHVEQEPPGLGLLGQLARILALADRELAGDRLRHAPALGAAAEVAGDPARDGVEPGAHRGAALELAEAAMNDQEDLLDRVVQTSGGTPRRRSERQTKTACSW